MDLVELKGFWNTRYYIKIFKFLMDLVELKAHDFYRHIISCGMLFLMDLVELKGPDRLFLLHYLLHVSNGPGGVESNPTSFRIFLNLNRFLMDLVELKVFFYIMF